MPFGGLGTLALLGLGGGVAIGGLIAGSDEAGLDEGDVIKGLKFRPSTGGAFLDQIEMETLLALGTPIDRIERSVLVNMLGENTNAGIARSFGNQIEQVEAHLAAGDTRAANDILRGLNLAMREFGREAAGAQLEIQDGSVRVKFQGGLGDQLAGLEEASNRISQNRLTANLRLSEVSNLGLREQEAAEFLRADLDDLVARSTDVATERANRLGTSPAAAIADLERQRLVEERKISSGGALQRALALSSGEDQLLRTSLQPPLLNALLSIQGQAVQGDSNALNTAAQLAIADAQAENARINRLSSGLGSLGTSLMGGAFGLMSSNKLAEALSGRSGTDPSDPDAQPRST